MVKNKIYGSGIIRMVLADPSECIDSENILPSIHKHYETIYEVGYGGNIIKMALKDLSHHFVELNKEKDGINVTLKRSTPKPPKKSTKKSE